jgi:hypothetical protein
MSLTITQKADTLGTCRFVLVRLMEMLAGWVATSPELEVKVLFGRHIWLLAQHADIVGQRALELRAKLHYQRPPATPYRDALAAARDMTASRDRVGIVYDALLPDLRERIARYQAVSDPLLDAPTVDIFDRILRDFDRMMEEARTVVGERPDVLTVTPGPAAIALRRTLTQCGEFVDYRESVVA